MSLLSKAGWSVLKRSIRAEFPTVRQISPATLSEWLNSAKPLLLDVRSPAEYAVSHLLGARLIDPEASKLDLPKDAPIVTYCSVGYRSTRLADRLQSAGFSQIANLEGSIFQWANEQRPVYQNGERVWRVHPYSRLWGHLLNPEFHSY